MTGGDGLLRLRIGKVFSEGVAGCGVETELACEAGFVLNRSSRDVEFEGTVFSFASASFFFLAAARAASFDVFPAGAEPPKSRKGGRTGSRSRPDMDGGRLYQGTSLNHSVAFMAAAELFLSVSDQVLQQEARRTDWLHKDCTLLLFPQN